MRSPIGDTTTRRTDFATSMGVLPQDCRDGRVIEAVLVGMPRRRLLPTTHLSRPVVGTLQHRPPVAIRKQGEMKQSRME